MCKKAIFGRKLSMTQFFSEDGDVITATIVKVDTVSVIRRKTIEIDGYESVEITFGEIKEKKITKPIRGHFEKYGTKVGRHVKEIRFDDCEQYNPGDQIDISSFSVGDYVDVTGTSKGKGFAGAIKRHGHKRGPTSHGSGYHRWAGSMGANSQPSRVFKGKKLPGHMGNKRVTVQNLKIVHIDAENRLIAIMGAIPGANKGIILIRNSVKLAS